jgi:drug/metabolite transporter (DMT)-like permease
MLSIIFGLCSALSWGAGDFCGGLATKRTSAYTVVILGDFAGAGLMAVLALLFHEPLPPSLDWLWAGLGGLAGSLGLIALYRALASGRMSVASPVAAIVSGALPIGIGALLQGWPTAWQLTGFAVALPAVWLLSSNERARPQWSELGLPALAGLGFGLFFVFIHQTSHTAVFWSLVAVRLIAIVALTLMALFTRQLQRPAPAQVPLILLMGVLDVGGNAFFALADKYGRLDAASVMSSLYPAATVALAWLVLKERISRQQLIGVGAALIAIALIAL